MKIECLQCENTGNGKEILAAFLRSFAAVARYGRTTIYEGDVYYIPYSMIPYHVEETGETYVFIASEVSEDISVYKQDGNNQIGLSPQEADPDFVLSGDGRQTELPGEVEKKIRMNRKMRKIFSRYHVVRGKIRTVYLMEQTFYGRGKSEFLFLVDPILQKVDFRNLHRVEERFAEQYWKQAAPMT